MAITIKTPRQVSQEYLDHLKALRPEINTDQEDSDWYIRSRVVGGVLSGVYADLSRVSNDAFPQTARREAVDKHLQVWTGAGLRAAQPAVGEVGVTGTSGTQVVVNTQLLHASTSNVYVVTVTTTLEGASASVPVQSVSVGQAQNLLTNTVLEWSTGTPAGLESLVQVLDPGLTDGRDVESTTDGANRVLDRIRNPAVGGNEADYRNWALAADPRVVSATVNRHAYGLGTVQLVISAGTNDIDAAIDNDLPIVVQPSAELKELVREYIDGWNPICDVVYVDGPTEVPVDITVKVAWNDGDQTTVVAGTTKTQGAFVIREIKRAIYKTPVGGRVVNSVGELRASDIEEALDFYLGSAPYTSGLTYQIVGDRQVTLSGGTPNVILTTSQLAVPGTITIEDM